MVGFSQIHNNKSSSNNFIDVIGIGIVDFQHLFVMILLFKCDIDGIGVLSIVSQSFQIYLEEIVFELPWKRFLWPTFNLQDAI